MTLPAGSDEDFRRLLARFVDVYADSLFNPHWGEGITISSEENTLDISMASAGLEHGRSAYRSGSPSSPG